MIFIFDGKGFYQCVLRATFLYSDNFYTYIHTYINSRLFPMRVGRNRRMPTAMIQPYIWSYKHAGCEYCAPNLSEEP